MSETQPREPRREDFQAPTGRNPFGTEIATRPVGALANAEQQRSIAEVQARMIIARSNPRDPIKAMDLILRDCTRATLAKGALYQYARGGSSISGPSIRLAEAIAQRWGNIASGIKELSRSAGYSECVAYAWDLESGYYDERQFQVKHWRDTQKGGYALTDERDIYELVANLGQRRKRAVMLTVIPGDVVEAAVEQCEQTLKSSFEATPEYLAQMLAAFAAFNVTKQQIEKRCQCHLEAIRPAQIVQLNKIYTSLNDGMSSIADWFDTPNGAWAATEEAHTANAAPAATQARAAPRKAATKKGATATPDPQEDGIPFDRWNEEGLGGEANQPPQSTAPVVATGTQATSESSNPNPPVANPVPAEDPSTAATPPSEERSTQPLTSDGMAFSVWLVDGEGSELPDSDGVFEPFTDPAAFATAFVEVRGNLFPMDIAPFEAANADNIEWAMRISDAARTILTPPAPPTSEPAKGVRDSDTLPLNLPPVDAAFIPPPTKNTKAEFTTYVERFKVLLGSATTDYAINHLVTVNSVTTERSDFLNSSRLQIKAATEARRKEITAPVGQVAETMEQLAVDLVAGINLLSSFEECDTWQRLPAVKARLADLEAGDPRRWVQVWAALRSRHLLHRVRACKTVAELQAMNRDPWAIEQLKWLTANAKLVADNTAAAAKSYAEELKAREGVA